MTDSALGSLMEDNELGRVQVSRLRLAVANGDARMNLLRGREFLDFHADRLIGHFREEEELLLPLLIPEGDEPPPLVLQAMIDHLTIRRRVMRLSEEVEGGRVSAEAIASIATMLEAHIKLDERELYPLLEASVGAEELAAIPFGPR